MANPKGNNVTERQVQNKTRQAQNRLRNIQGNQYMGLPLISSGYMDLLMQAPQLRQEAQIRGLGHQSAMTDLGVRFNRNNRVVRDDNRNPFGAWQEGSRQAKYASADAGFGTRGLMRRARFEPTRQEITRSAVSSRRNMRDENRFSRQAWRRQRQMFLQGLPSWAIQQRAWGSAAGGDE